MDKIDKKSVIKLTEDVYKLTLLFPKKEPMRYKLREIADNALESFVNMENIALKGYINVIKAYLEVSKWQNWVSYFDILNIEAEYEKINQEIKKPEAKPAPAMEEPASVPLQRDYGVARKSSFEQRKQKIMDVLGQKQKIQVWEINRFFSDISKRTIRRDFVELLKQGLVERIGEKSGTFYKLKS